MDDLYNFLAMDGYGGFVWAAFGLTAIVLVGLLGISRRQAKVKEEMLANLQSRLSDGRRRDAR